MESFKLQHVRLIFAQQEIAQKPVAFSITRTLADYEIEALTIWTAQAHAPACFQAFDPHKQWRSSPSLIFTVSVSVLTKSKFPKHQAGEFSVAR